MCINFCTIWSCCSTPKIKYILFFSVRVVCVCLLWTIFDAAALFFLWALFSLRFSLYVIEIYICMPQIQSQCVLCCSFTMPCFTPLQIKNQLHQTMLKCSETFVFVIISFFLICQCFSIPAICCIWWLFFLFISAHTLNTHVYIIQDREPGMHSMNHTHLIVLKTVSLLWNVFFFFKTKCNSMRPI